MDWANLAIAAIGSLAGVAGVYVAWRALPQQRRRRKPKTTPELPPVNLPPDGQYDAFISYAEQDAAQAEQLATRLRDDGLKIFLAAWIGLGTVELLAKEEAIPGSANGVLLFSEASMAEPAIRQDYAALLERVHTGGRLFIPVRIDDVELPPFTKIRKPLDLRGAEGEAYDQKVTQLARALRGRDAPAP